MEARAREPEAGPVIDREGDREMDLEAFRSSLDGDAPPEGLGPALQALWLQAKGNWEAAHRLSQAQNDEAGAWVHAYLHRVEGDLGNAAYWYRRANKPRCDAPLAKEWAAIVSALL